jgi:hypothetical protein
MEQAFALLRDYARNHNLRLADLAQTFIDGTQTMADQTAAPLRRSSAPTGQVRRQPRPAAPHTAPRNGPPADRQPT